MDNIFKCLKCSKILSTKYTLKNHEDKCNGIKLKKCENCNHEFSTNYNLKVHIEKGCKKENIKIIDGKYQCEYCNNLYSTKHILQQHQNKSCKIKEHLLLLNNNNEDNNNLKLELAEIKKMLIKIATEKNINLYNNNNSHNTNINTNNTMNNTQINNINLFSMGKEDLNRLSPEEKLALCTGSSYYQQNAVDLIQCNKKYPEFHNVLITDENADKGMAFINNEWVEKSSDEILTNLMESNKNHIRSLIDNIKVSNDKEQLKLEETKEEILNDENIEGRKIQVKKKLYKAANMITKNKNLLE